MVTVDSFLFPTLLYFHSSLTISLTLLSIFEEILVFSLSNIHGSSCLFPSQVPSLLLPHAASANGALLSHGGGDTLRPPHGYCERWCRLAYPATSAYWLASPATSANRLAWPSVVAAASAVQGFGTLHRRIKLEDYTKGWWGSVIILRNESVIFFIFIYFRELRRIPILVLWK